MLWQLHLGKEPWFATQVTLVLLEVIAIHSWTNFLQLWVWNLFYLLEFFLSAISLFFEIGNGAQKAAEQLQGVLISGGSLFIFILALHEQQLSWIAFLLGDNEKILLKFLFRGDFLFLTLSPFSLPLFFLYLL